MYTYIVFYIRLYDGMYVCLYMCEMKNSFTVVIFYIVVSVFGVIVAISFAAAAYDFVWCG